MMREIEEVLNKARAISEHQPIFLRAIQEVFEAIEPAVSRHRQYIRHGILERMVEPSGRSFSECPGSTTRADNSEPRLSHRNEQRHRSVQGRPEISSERQFRDSEVSRVRANI
jgi:hypothetical protein